MTTRYFTLKYPQRNWWSLLGHQLNQRDSLLATRAVLQRWVAMEVEQNQFDLDKKEFVYGGCLYGRYRYCYCCQLWVPRFVRVRLFGNDVDLLVSCALDKAAEGKETCPFCLTRLDY